MFLCAAVKPYTSSGPFPSSSHTHLRLKHTLQGLEILICSAAVSKLQLSLLFFVVCSNRRSDSLSSQWAVSAELPPCPPPEVGTSPQKLGQTSVSPNFQSNANTALLMPD